MHGAVKDFIGKPAPPNYVAGLGRGATGFTTRSDIGPARQSDAPGDQPTEQQKPEKDDDNDRFQDPDNEFGLFSNKQYEEDDKEADRIWEMVDKKMEDRRRKRKEKQEQEDMKRSQQTRPKISDQFIDLKRSLATITEDEWKSLPESSDFVGKGRKRSKALERFTPLPDSQLMAAEKQIQYDDALDNRQQMQLDGSAAPDGTDTDFRAIGQARDKVLGLKLDRAGGDSVSGQTTIDPKGYLTGLGSVEIKSDTEIGDIKRGRLLLHSVITTNPKHGPGWIAAARLEEVAGKPVQARKIIANGCKQCPKSTEVWLEAARLNTVDNAKIILADAIRQLPDSIKIWRKAADLETEIANKKKVLRRALEFIPNSVQLWMEAIRLEDERGAKVLLSRAVELIPHNEDLWIALARLETFEKAQKALNKARLLIPTSHGIWIAAARLIEGHIQTTNEKTAKFSVLSRLQENRNEGESDEHNETKHNEIDSQAQKIDLLIEKALMDLQRHSVVLEREQWLAEAQKCENNQSILTCQAIVKATINFGVEEEDRKRTWKEDAQSCIAQGNIHTARAIYAHALKVFPGKKSLWRLAADLEKRHGTPESLDEVLATAVKYCPRVEILWLMRAKEKWLAGYIDDARGILEQAFKANPDSEQIWLAAVKVESESGEVDRARSLLKKAREESNTERVWMKSAVLERQMKDYSACLEIVEEALEKYPTFDKLWLIKGQVEDDALNNQTKARETYGKGVKNCPSSLALWIHLALLEERIGLATKARSTLEKARYANPKQAELWLQSIRLEIRDTSASSDASISTKNSASNVMISRALKECPNAGAIWREAIFAEARPQRKARSVDALKQCNNDPIVVTTVARLFWTDRKIEKARSWFEKAVGFDADQGDSYVWWYKFEQEHGLKEQQDKVVKTCVLAEPRHGELWQSVAKHMDNVGKKPDEILRICAELAK